MELYPLKVFLTVATEKSFSRAAEKLLRTQPAISLAIQRLESGPGREADRPVRQRPAADRRRAASCSSMPAASRTCRRELENSLAELRDNSAGRLIDRRERIHHALPAAAHRRVTGGCIRK